MQRREDKRKKRNKKMRKRKKEKIYMNHQFIEHWNMHFVSS